MRNSFFFKWVVSMGITCFAIATPCRAITIINDCTDVPRTPLKFFISKTAEDSLIPSPSTWEKEVPYAGRDIVKSTEFSASELDRMREWLEADPARNHRIHITVTMGVIHVPPPTFSHEQILIENLDRVSVCSIDLTRAQEVDHLNDATITFKTPPEWGTFVLPEERMEDILVKPAGERGIVHHPPSP